MRVRQQIVTAVVVLQASQVDALLTAPVSRLAARTHAASSWAANRSSSSSISMVSLSPSVEEVVGTKVGGTADAPFPMNGVTLSGLQGKALVDREWPKKFEVLAKIPKHCFEKDTTRSMLYMLQSVSMTLACGALGALLIPLKVSMLPLWIAYACVTGTVATGAWVVAHECGHNAFSDNKFLQDLVGYVLHSSMLVPYFSWQRSHAVHHARTNHMTEGETHVPPVADGALGKMHTGLRTGLQKVLGKTIGVNVFGFIQLVLHLGVGWPAYILFGATGGPIRGVTNHFVPINNGPEDKALFPGKWKAKVLGSTAGVGAVIAGLCLWAKTYGFWNMAALYGGPLMVVNAWLVGYTWMQHTSEDTPHYSHENWNFVKGAFHTIDRPYGKVFDFLHHRIGSTHVAHHLSSNIPHYHALEATEAVRAAYPDLYLFDPTPVHVAMWNVAKNCVHVEERQNKWVFVN